MEIYLNGILLVLLICRFILLQQNNTGYNSKFNGDISKWNVSKVETHFKFVKEGFKGKLPQLCL